MSPRATRHSTSRRFAVPDGGLRRDAAFRTRSCGRLQSSIRNTSRASTIAGADTISKWALLEGALFADRSNFGETPQPVESAVGKRAAPVRAGDQTVKFIITRDPKFDPLHIRSEEVSVAHRHRCVDHGRHRCEPRAVPREGRQDHHDSRHGRTTSSRRTIRSHITRSRSRSFGQSRLDSFMRFYVIPGFGHGFRSVQRENRQPHSAAELGREGSAADRLTAVDGNQGPTAGRSRPLCEWPRWPKFTGKPGAENSSASFTCVDK